MHLDLLISKDTIKNFGLSEFNPNKTKILFTYIKKNFQNYPSFRKVIKSFSCKFDVLINERVTFIGLGNNDCFIFGEIFKGNVLKSTF